MPNAYIGKNVFDAALDRLTELYEEGHRVVVSFSGGKDSGVCLELAIVAASIAGRLPVTVVMRDEEIMLPGTFEYAERVAAREEVDFHWMIARQPVINVFNRKSPYFWTFDPLLSPDEWVRPWPTLGYEIPEKHIQGMVTKERFPPDEGKDLITVMGLRTSESMGRRMGLYSSGGYLTKGNEYGVRYARPIYDWQDGDVWLAHKTYSWDYNEAYDYMNRLGVSRRDLRIAPPTLTPGSVRFLEVAAKAHPRWFDRVSKRLPGVRTAGLYGKISVEPFRKWQETWEQCYDRTCIREAPEWIAERAVEFRNAALTRHFKHTTDRIPEVRICSDCGGFGGSWKRMAKIMFNGDPFCSKQTVLKVVEPEFFREGAGVWGGKPTW